MKLGFDTSSSIYPPGKKKRMLSKAADNAIKTHREKEKSSACRTKHKSFFRNVFPVEWGIFAFSSIIIVNNKYFSERLDSQNML